MSVATEKEHEERTLNAENWKGHEEQIEQMFSLYRDKINPMVAVYNSATNQFPAGVLNELRDAFSHLTQSLEDPEKTGHQLERAQSHCKRAAVDGFKYAAMAYDKVYEDFQEAYRRVDLSYVDNGQFLPRVARLRATAWKRLTEAREVEASVHTEEEMYEAYEDAFNCYAELYDCVMDAIEPAETVRLRAEEEQESQKKERSKDRTIAIVCGVISVISIFITAASILGNCT